MIMNRCSNRLKNIVRKAHEKEAAEKAGQKLRNQYDDYLKQPYQPKPAPFISDKDTKAVKEAQKTSEKPQETATTVSPEKPVEKDFIDLSSTFDALKINTAKRESINTLLREQKSNLTLDSGVDLKECTFTWTSINIPGFPKQKIIGLDINKKTFIITESGGRKFYFAPPKG